jgi:hypothetical protein
MSTYDQFLSAIGFGGQPNTLSQQYTAARTDLTEREADLARKRTEFEAAQRAQQVDYNMEDRGIYNSGIRSEAQADVEAAKQADLADIELRRQQKLTDIQYAGARAALDELQSQSRSALELELSRAQLDAARAAAARDAQLFPLQQMAIWKDIQYKQSLIDSIGRGWG